MEQHKAIFHCENALLNQTFLNNPKKIYPDMDLKLWSSDKSVSDCMPIFPTLFVL